MPSIKFKIANFHSIKKVKMSSTNIPVQKWTLTEIGFIVNKFGYMVDGFTVSG